jgi:hypothetical protein
MATSPGRHRHVNLLSRGPSAASSFGVPGHPADPRVGGVPVTQVAVSAGCAKGDEVVLVTTERAGELALVRDGTVLARGAVNDPGSAGFSDYDRAGMSLGPEECGVRVVVDVPEIGSAPSETRLLLHRVVGAELALVLRRGIPHSESRGMMADASADVSCKRTSSLGLCDLYAETIAFYACDSPTEVVEKTTYRFDGKVYRARRR